MLSDDELKREILDYLRHNPTAFPVSSITYKFKITEDKAYEVLRRIMLELNLHG